jgi:hypothetical protein
VVVVLVVVAVIVMSSTTMSVSVFVSTGGVMVTTVVTVTYSVAVRGGGVMVVMVLSFKTQYQSRSMWSFIHNAEGTGRRNLTGSPVTVDVVSGEMAVTMVHSTLWGKRGVG